MKEIVLFLYSHDIKMKIVEIEIGMSNEKPLRSYRYGIIVNKLSGKCADKSTMTLKKKLMPLFLHSSSIFFDSSI